MSLVQHELADFLQCELLHTLGCYGVVVERLRDLDERVSRMGRRETDRLDSLFPTDALTIVRRYNEALRAALHLPSVATAGKVPEARHPAPQRRLDGSVVRDRWVLDFYATAERGLGIVAAGDLRPLAERSALETLGHILSIVHDPQRRGADLLMPVGGRVARTRERLDVARRLFAASGEHPTGWSDRGSDNAVWGAKTEEVAGCVVSDCLSRPDEDPLHIHVLGALVDAHICMHHAEHLMARCFGERVERRNELERETELQLRRSLVLNTFVYVVGRATPWVFAEDEEERAFVVANYQTCCDRLYPTYCLWIGSQISLLALHRRAYTFMLLGKHAQAYNDFHKLRRFVRHLKRQVGKAVAMVPGGDAFLTGLDAFADHHSGRIYRGQHAYTVALRHFERASKGLGTLEQEPTMHAVIKNSRWRIDLLMSQAKANYELGRFKHALSCYAKAWHAFLELADTESRARANFAIVDEVIAWLDLVEDDSEIDKVEVGRRLEPLVEQFRLVRGPRHVRALAAEIMLHVGHVLFILRLPRMQGEQVLKRRFRSHSTIDASTVDPSEGRYHIVDHRLAHRCLIQAARLDPTSTLIAHDALKFEFWDGELDIDPETGRPVRPPSPVDITRQWPSGGSEFEEAARVVEYVLQQWLSGTFKESGADAPAEEQIARRLLAAFLAHTDSSNVKLAQVYRFLMQESPGERGGRWGDEVSAEEDPALEFVCLRRYSSFFPFLPTPSAFPVLGGGYFIRVEVPGEAPYGVAIDPGPHFVDNLYRCGFCLDDIDMIVATHDHADHIASLDALLTLLGYRAIYGAPTFGEGRELAIVGNESIKRRYSYFNEKPREDFVSVWSFEEWESGVREPRGDGQDEDWMTQVKRCPGLHLRRVETVNHTDGAGKLAQGFLLGVGDGPARTAVLFTSDTGLPENFDERSSSGSAPMSLAEAVDEADLIVAHVSSAPLAELRQLAGFEHAPQQADLPTKQFKRLWNSLAKQVTASEADADLHSRRGRFLLRQLQFGFHSRPSREERAQADGLKVSPLSSTKKIAKPSVRHLYVMGLISIARRMQRVEKPQVLLVGELREELGTFRTRIAAALNVDIFGERSSIKRAFTADVGFKIRLQPGQHPHRTEARVVCTTCDMDNDLVAIERLHEPDSISEVCVKGENEGIFYNCDVHEPLVQPHPLWVERIERYEPFGY